VIQQLRQRGLGVHALVVGEGPARDRLDGLEGAVLTGHLDGDELGRAIASADILLHPSRTETFGNVVLEAMAAGLAVVCADADSARCLVENERTGLLYSAKDNAGLLDALAVVVRDADRRRALGRAARAASARFSWDAASQSVLDAYEQLVSSL
jgi:glycosyltransferase involved in cell wall biosynthesis